MRFLSASCLFLISYVYELNFIFKTLFTSLFSYAQIDLAGCCNRDRVHMQVCQTTKNSSFFTAISISNNNRKVDYFFSCESKLSPDLIWRCSLLFLHWYLNSDYFIYLLLVYLTCVLSEISGVVASEYWFWA